MTTFSKKFNKQKFLIGFIVILILPFIHVPDSDAYTVAVLRSSRIKPYDEAVQGFKSSCGCTIEDIHYEGMNEREIRAEIASSGADAVLAVGMDALGKTLRLVNIPVFYTMVPSPPPSKAGPSVISGTSMSISPEKFLDSIHALFGKGTKVGVIYDPKNSGAFMEKAAGAAKERGIGLVTRQTGTPSEVIGLVDSMKNSVDLIWMLPDPTVINPETVKHMLNFSFQNRVPLFTFTRKYVEMGAVAGLVMEPFSLGQETGEIARARFVNPGARPVQSRSGQPRLLLNRKIADKLGVRISAEEAENVR